MLSDPDLRRLAGEYTDAELERGHTERVAARLGLTTPNASNLAETILNDLDVDSGGVRWWTTPPKREAILIADHAFQAAGAPLGLLLEARFHLSALERIWLTDEGRWIAQVRRTGLLTHPESKGPLDDASNPEESLHLTGFFRCVAQVLDCLAAAVIVVADLPASTQRAAWPLSEAKIARFTASTEGEAAKAVLDRIWDAVDGAGPEGWSTWAVAMRHLLVHRPRLLGFNQIYGAGGGLYVAGSENGGNLRLCHHLPRQPQRAWIESLTPNDPALAYLEEHAGLTLSNLHRSTVTVVEGVAAELTARWEARRTVGVEQVHWREQWPERRSTPSLGFAGYAPGERPFAGDRIVLNSVDATRFRAAQLGDSDRSDVWG